MVSTTICIEHCKTLIHDIDKVQGTEEYRSVSLPKAKKIKLPNASLDTLRLYAEQIIQYGGSTDWSWLRLMEPLGETRDVLIAYKIIDEGNEKRWP